MSNSDESVPKIEFKRKTRKPLRKRIPIEEEDDDGEDDSLREKLEELKTIQKLREKGAGVKIDGDLLGEKNHS